MSAIDLILAGRALHLPGRDQGDVPVPDAHLGHHHHHHPDLIIMTLPSHWASETAGAGVAPSLSFFVSNLTLWPLVTIYWHRAPLHTFNNRKSFQQQMAAINNY